MTIKQTFHTGSVLQRSDQHEVAQAGGITFVGQKVAQKCHLGPETPRGLALNVKSQG
jgi:hypothetical protein